MSLVVADEAKRQAMLVLCDPYIRRSTVKELMNLVDTGSFGRNENWSFLGFIASHSGLTASDLRERYGFSLDPKENPVEAFCSRVRPGHKPENSADAAFLAMWCDEALRSQSFADQFPIRYPCDTDGEPVGI